MRDLSVIIPSRNEEFLKNTVESVLENIEADTEVIAVCDGSWPDPAIQDHPRVTLIHHSVPIGQRAATNEAAKLSQAKFIMKLDAHCSVDKGFDRKLMEDCEYDWTVIPMMYSLDAFHWVCKQCGTEYDQGPTRAICDKCGDGRKFDDFERKIIWKHKRRKRTHYMWFDKNLRIRYFDKTSLKNYGEPGELKVRCSHKKRDWAQGDITDVMCGIGACWFQHRERYWELGGLDESHGSWGQVSVEVACKAWLSGGRQVVNKKTWFAHLARTQPGFSWPYHNPASAQEKARQYSRDMWLNDKWPGQKRKISWLIDKFSPLPSWEVMAKSSKGLVYYTDNKCDQEIMNVVKGQIERCVNGNELVSVSHKPIDLGKNIVMDLESSPLSMYQQILKGLETIESEVVFLVEHDVLYHPSHFEFEPPRKDTFYYNQNRWKVDYKTGQALFYYTKSQSSLVGHKDLMIKWYANRIKMIEERGKHNPKWGFEPGGPGEPGRKGDPNKNKYDVYFSEFPNLDIRHDNNMTRNRFRRKQFRNKHGIKGWALADEVPYWGKTKGRFQELLNEVGG